MRAWMPCLLVLCFCAGRSPAAGKPKIDPSSLHDLKLKVTLSLSRSKSLRSRDVAYSYFPGGKRCAFQYTGPGRPETIAALTKLGLKTTIYVSPTADAASVKALEEAGAEVGVSGYWGAHGGYASLIAGNSAQGAFDAIATSRLAVRNMVRGAVLPSGGCGGHCSTYHFVMDRNMDASSGYGAVFLDSNFLNVGFSSQQCLSIFLGLEGPERVVVRKLNRNTMRSKNVPNELIYFQLLAGQFEGAVRKAREGQVVQFSLRDFKAEDMKMLEESIGAYGKHPAIWHATDGMIASGEYARKNVHILEVRKSGAKQVEVALGVEKDTFAPYLITPLSLSLPKRFPIESASFEGAPCGVTVDPKTPVPIVTIPIHTHLAGGCAMSLKQSAQDMTVPDRMPATLTIRNTLDKPITDAKLTWVGSSRFSGLTPARRGRGVQTGVKAGPGLTVRSTDDGPFTLGPGKTKTIAATATTVRGARFGIIPVQAVLKGKVDGRERVFLGGFEITVAPMMRVDMIPNLRMPLPKGRHQYFEVRLANGKARDKFIHHKAGPCRGVLSFDLADGLVAEPAEQAFDFKAGDSKTFQVKITNTQWGAEDVKIKPIITLAGSKEALELLEPGTTVVRDEAQVAHKPLDETGLLVYWGFNDDKQGARFARSAGRAGGHLFPGTTTAYAPGGVRGACIRSQPNCSIHGTYKNIDYRQGTILFWFKRDPRVKNDNRYIATSARPQPHGGRSNYGEGLVFVRGVQRNGPASGGLDVRRYATWGGKEGFIEVTYRCLGGRKYYVRAPYPRSAEKDWRHVAVTWNVKDRLLELFVNGKSAGKADPGEGPWRAVPWDNAADWGHPLVVSTMDHGHWSGTMRDEFYIYNRPLTPKEIAANMRLASQPVGKP